MARMNMHAGRFSRSFAASALLAVATMGGCDNSPGKDKAQATVGSPVTVASAAPSVGSTKLAFAPPESQVAFTGAKVTGKHDGSFGSFNGTIQLVDGNPEKSTVSVDIDMATLSADNEKLTGHLKSPDLFDVAKFPKAHFVSTAIKPGGEKGATHTVTGNLELHGVTKSISFPATSSNASP